MKKILTIFAILLVALVCVLPFGLAFGEELAEQPTAEENPLEALKGVLTDEQISALEELLEIVKENKDGEPTNFFVRVWEWVKRNYTVVIALGILFYETIKGFVDRKAKKTQKDLLATNNNIVKATNANTTANADLIETVETQTKTAEKTRTKAEIAEAYSKGALELVYLLVKSSNATTGTKDIADQRYAEILKSVQNIGGNNEETKQN